MTPTQLSKELRTGEGDFLEERRSVIVLSLTAIGRTTNSKLRMSRPWSKVIPKR
ncbi:MAG: hypothetical protein H0W04_08175 [Chthoniobacterales bacterium]|nr:hypothetical protein [Chthoniobacterales bacterium]